MRRYRKKKERKLLVFALALFFTFSSVVLGMKLPSYLKQMNEVKETLARVNEEKEQHEDKIATSKVAVQKLQEEIETLDNKLQQTQQQQPQLYQLLKEQEMRYAYLTFDDGPSDNTEKILDFLKANGIKATFFVIGTEGNDDIYKRIVEEGHTIGIHSNTHKYHEIYLSVESYMKDIETLSDHIYGLTGVRSKILRFPGGSNNTLSKKYNTSDLMGQIIQRVTEEGYHYFDWNVDSADASATCQDKDIIVKSVLEGAKDKKSSIILLHDAGMKTTTVEALPEIVEGLRNQGYVFDKISEETYPVRFQ